MNQEKECVYEIETEVSDLNEHNLLKPYAYQRLFGQVAEQHLNRHKVNVASIMKYHLAWALRSLSIEIVKPVEGCVKLFSTTWYSQRKGPCFRREIVFRDAQGEVRFKGALFSVLLDLEKRAIYRSRELPFALFDPVEEFTIEAGPSFETDAQFRTVDQRRVYNSHIDCVGHVNNCRYGEFAYDALDNNELDGLAGLRRMEVYFVSELRREEAFSLQKGTDGGRVVVRGHNETRNCRSFDVVFTVQPAAAAQC